MNLTPKKQAELNCVRYFLINLGKKIDESKFAIPEKDELIDILYGERKFQITKAPAEVEEVIGKLNKKSRAEKGSTSGEILYIQGRKIPMWTSDFNISDSFQKFIIEPINNKKYDTSAVNDIILLIYSSNSALIQWNDLVWQDFKSKNKDYFASTGFKEIYLVDQKTNLEIYPKIS